MELGDEHKHNPQLLLNMFEDKYKVLKKERKNSNDQEWAEMSGAINRFCRAESEFDPDWKPIGDNIFRIWQALRRLLDLHARSSMFGRSEKVRVKREYDVCVSDLIHSITKWRRHSAGVSRSHTPK